MSNEGKIKLKVKVDASELVKVKGALQDIHNAELEGSKSGENAVEKKKKTKVATEELTKSQQFAAEMAKTLGEEQNQLVTNVDAAEVAQKALGAALQSYVGISPVAIGATLAIGAAAYQLTQQYKELDNSLAANGVSWNDYISGLIRGRDVTQTFSIRQNALSAGFKLTATELDSIAGSIERYKRVLGENAREIIERASQGDASAARQFNVVFRDGMTAMEKRKAVLDGLIAIDMDQSRQERSASAEARRQALADYADMAGSRSGAGGASQAGQAAQDAADRVREINDRANREQAAAAQILFAQRQDIVDRGVMAYQNSMRAIEQVDQTRLENYLKGNGSLEVSDQELTNRRIGWLQTLNSIRITSDMNQEQRDAARQTRQQAANQALAAETELRNRNNTTQGIKNRLYQEALGRAIASGADIHRLERLSISNSQIRVQLEAKLAELKAKVATQTGAAAEGTRREIAGILNEIRGISGGGGSSPLIALSEIRNMILAVGKASIEASQNDFVQGIREGTISIEEQTRRLNLLRQARDIAETRNREALLRAQTLAEQLDDATNARQRQRLALQQRTANENLQRTQDSLRTAVSAYDSAGQAIAQSIREREEKANQERLNAEKQEYDFRTRAIQNASRNTQDSIAQNRQYFDAYMASLDGSASDYQRTIAELFSPEKLIENINRGVRDASAVVASEQQRLSQMIASGASQEDVQTQSQRVVDARRNEAAATRDATQAVADLQQRMNDASFGGQFAKAMTNNAKGMASMGEYAGGLAAKGLNTFADAIWTSLDAIKSGEDVGAALNKMLSATLQSIGQEATVRALMETAAGFAALATPVTAPAAAGHFAAAGVYAGVAALAGVGYMALPTPPEKADREREDTRSERDMLNARQNGNTVVFNSAAFAATKEELAKTGRKILSSGIDL